MSSTELSSRSPEAIHAAVPMGYAEKAMASLMQLHSELMDEKESRVDLYRRLMEKEQALAELKMYVKLLEEKVTAKKVVRKVPVPPATPRRSAATAPAPTAPSLSVATPPSRPRLVVAPPQVSSTPASDPARRSNGAGWKTW